MANETDVLRIYKQLTAEGKEVTQLRMGQIYTLGQKGRLESTEDFQIEYMLTTQDAAYTKEDAIVRGLNDEEKEHWRKS